ncbi:hypothetical protein [Nonomuraea typhae]|uniref:Uncharacterized protein n=1 Tax=Nonomuraea typhae TaxID=2603600 RepID=A0ABW7YQS4_9ACTN
MSREGADHELHARAEERDRISGDLLDLEAHTTYQLLKGAALRGETGRRWTAAQAFVAEMWALYDLYRAVLRAAEEVRARRGRPGPAELAEITALLLGSSVVLKAAVKPVELRTLGEAEPDEHLTLNETVARMDAAFGEITATLQAVDAVWNPALPRLEQAEAAAQELAAMSRELGERVDLSAVETALSRVRAEVVEDPIGAAPPGPELDRITALLAAGRADLERALAVKRDYAARRDRLLTAIDTVRQAEAAARMAHGQVVVKINLPASAAPASRLHDLTTNFARVDAATDGWLARSAHLDALEKAAAEAARQARDKTRALFGLIQRRDELRGLLTATNAKAARVGLAEDLEATRLYETARTLLWSAPCDLRQAAAAVDLYQNAIHGGSR